MRQDLLVLGGGFAGFWAAAAAMRALDRAGAAEAVRVTLVNPDPFHVNRVRGYEMRAPDEIRIPLAELLDPIGVGFVEATAVAVDPARRVVALRDAAGQVAERRWDALVLATGSTLWRPAVPGLAEHALDVDTATGAARLRGHVAGLPARRGEGRWTAVVIGAGLVGIELACELPARRTGPRG